MTRRRALIEPETMRFYRALTPTGWATYDSDTGASRASTPGEAAVAEDQARPKTKPQEPEA
ncbi:hypothetical protein SAMN06297129_3984 [Pseudooceanicola antarcticus]|uniref:Uncharacterized protein n=1 Tax=Pseudooceanicola antarcticus TaxID=1247613 RepID=A0A285JNC9_9RHOB|nr:hypothetical protein [Pseudooceanicola antarcticus]PJE26503.1 hypothetical protein CVM39_17490 [Pseudooceanicola antarcticus]SNY60836.1 hypothetical protein SAMN06297129_3984 [Pseudooceanicola antarcticus]